MNLGLLPPLGGIFDEPFPDSFGGYEAYAAAQILGTYQRLPWAVRTLARGAVALLPVSHGKVTLGSWRLANARS